MTRRSRRTADEIAKINGTEIEGTEQLGRRGNEQLAAATATAEQSTITDPVGTSASPTSELRDPPQHCHVCTNIVPTAGLTFSDLAVLHSRITDLERELEELKRQPSAIQNPLPTPPITPVRPRGNSSSTTSTCADLTDVTSFDLFKPPISKSTIKDAICLTALSANGKTMVLSTEKIFRIFRFQGSDSDVPVHLVCSGQFTNEARPYFRYPQKGARMETQLPLPKTLERMKIGRFSCLTVSNEYLAVGCKGRMMVFIIEGKYAGRWVCDAVYEEKTFVEKLEFSADGRTLVTLLRSEGDKTAMSKALIYSTEDIQKDKLDREHPAQPVLESPLESPALAWEAGLDAPRCIAFSGDGRTIAISTAHDARGMAKIRLLMKVGTEWRNLGLSQPLPILAPNDMFGLGLTGIRL